MQSVQTMADESSSGAVAAGAPGADLQPWPSPARAWFAIFVLVLAVALAFVDRIVLALLVDPIRKDLGLQDYHLGLLLGFAFSAFYMVAAFPIARLADRHSRRLIIVCGIFCWSVMTAVCGLARSFADLFMARAGVAVGEATLQPSAFSMIADYFPRERLGLALGVYQSGIYLGVGFAFLAGGAVIELATTTAAGTVLPLVGQLRPWQFAFMAVAVPGLFVAALLLAVKEPARRGGAASGVEKRPVREVFVFLRGHARAYGGQFFGFALLAVPSFTIAMWAPSYFIRVLGYAPADAARTLGFMVLFLSPAGALAAGLLADRWQRQGHLDAPIRVAMVAVVALLATSISAPLMTDPGLAFWLFCPFVFASSMPAALAPTALQLITPNRYRAQMSAGLLLTLNLISSGIGPTAVGYITGAIFADDKAVGQSMAVVNGVALLLAAVVLLWARRAFREAAAEQAREGQ